MRVKNYTLNADNFLDALTKVATKFHVPIGVQWSENSDTKRKVSASWANVDVQQVIQQLIGAHPGYEFDVTDGVLHVFPEWTKSNRQDFVNLNLPNFVVRNQMPETATHQLRDLVKLNVSPSPLPKPGVAGGTGYSQGADVGEQNISLRLQNVTVQEALDKIALASDRKIWVVTFTDEPLTPTGFRRTRTLWIKTIAYNEQPVWDSLRWGDEIPPSK
ncbi:MAG TPA: hypothetical protein VNF02_01180 [Candidatus Limnocylindrales bacterium]|nr:hypothetical protein [Candidatus Limnocylindrales bacterium]